jgi:hypothetical protein
MSPSNAKRGARRRPLILLTNDDGFFAEGIRSLLKGLRGLGTLVVVAPDREKSASSLSLTLHRPLRVQKTGPGVFAVDGTPADCVYIAVRKLLPRPPDLLVSGINRGPNLGQQDISYSGTAAAAVQGTYLGIHRRLPDPRRRRAVQLRLRGPDRPLHRRKTPGQARALRADAQRQYPSAAVHGCADHHLGGKALYAGDRREKGPSSELLLLDRHGRASAFGRSFERHPRRRRRRRLGHPPPHGPDGLRGGQAEGSSGCSRRGFRR